MADYIADVKKYDATASEEVVGKIVKHLGVALRRRDSSVVFLLGPQGTRTGKEKLVRQEARRPR